ncbi:MAG: folylpolyglutamate synthase/dihydrofolate synthase family protein [Nocardioidaceae bacterium]
MSAAADPARRSEAYVKAEQQLLARWPETKLDPSLNRVAALCDLLGQPQRAFPIVHLTGTNGKTSTSRMIDTLLRGLGLRTGRFTSPHVEAMTERISVDGCPLTSERFVEVYDEVAPYAAIVDRSGGHPLSFFELITAMGFAAFADAPVDAAVIEVGMGGTWDATNVADASVAVVTPIGVDHANYLGDTSADIAVEKAGIIKPGSVAVLAVQPPEAAEVLLRHIADVGAAAAREGFEFGVVDRLPGLGGQLLTLQGLEATYHDVFLPLYGAHQAQNAVCALAAVEAFAGASGEGSAIDVEVVRDAFAQVSSPGRLEIVRRSPTVLIDAAHNPDGARATAEAIQEAFAFSPLVGVCAVMADKDVEGVLDAFEPVLSMVVCTQNSTPRSLRADVLADVARGIFGADRVQIAPRLDDAIELAVSLAESGEGAGSGSFGGDIGFGGGGVLVTGSVITAGEARTLLGSR